jgi:hypothetical protein
LVSQSPPWWVHWQQKQKVWSSNSRPHEAQLENPKAKKKAQEGHLEEGKPEKPIIGKKGGKTKQNGTEELERAQGSKKRSKSTQKLKRVRKSQKLHKRSKSTLPLKSTPPNPLNASTPP